MKQTKKYYYINMYTGELLTLAEMLAEARAEYDIGDPCSIVTLADVYQLTNIIIKY